MNQYPIMPPMQGSNDVGLSPNTSKVPPPNTAKLPTQSGISPAVQALMNAQAQQNQLGPRQPAPGARQVRPGQQFQSAAPQHVVDPAAQQRQLMPQALAKPAPYQPPATDPTLPVTTPQPMPFQNIRGDQASMARAQYDPSMEQRMRAFGPRVR